MPDNITHSESKTLAGALIRASRTDVRAIQVPKELRHTVRTDSLYSICQANQSASTAFAVLSRSGAKAGCWHEQVLASRYKIMGSLIAIIFGGCVSVRNTKLC